MMVFSNEKELEGKDAVFNAIFSPFDIFFTGKNLNKKGKKWRSFVVSSVLGLMILIALGLYFKPCLASRLP